MSGDWSRHIWVAFSMALLLAASPKALAGYKEDYQNAVKQIEQGQFQQGLNLLERIPEIEQQELNALPVGNGQSIVYLPKYYKGLAAFNLGNCQLAETNFISSLAQQVVKRIKSKHDKLKQIRAVCRSRLVNGQYIDKLQNLTKTTSDKVGQLISRRNTLNKLKKDPTLKASWHQDSYFQRRLNDTTKKANLAKKELDKIKLMPYSTTNRDYIVRLNKRLTTQIQRADQNAKDFSAYRNSIRSLRNAFQKADQSLDELTAMKTNRVLADDWKNTGKLSQSLLKLTQQKQDLVSQSKSLTSIKTQEELSSAIVTGKVITRKTTEISQQLNRLLSDAKNKVSLASSNLEKEKQVIYRGANAFFSGSYGKAIMILTRAEMSHNRSRYFQNLFIAAAYFNDPELADSIAEEKAKPYIVKAKSIQSKEDFDEGYFSPKFVKFFRETNQ